MVTVVQVNVEPGDACGHTCTSRWENHVENVVSGEEMANREGEAGESVGRRLNVECDPVNNNQTRQPECRLGVGANLTKLLGLGKSINTCGANVAHNARRGSPRSGVSTANAMSGRVTYSKRTHDLGHYDRESATEGSSVF